MDARVSVAVFAFLVLAAVLASFLRNGSERSHRRSLFVALMVATMVLLACSALTWGLDGQPGALTRWVLTVVSAIYFALQPVVATLWMGYLWYWLPPEPHRPAVGRVRTVSLAISVVAVVANTVVCVANLFLPLFFFIDEANRYHRGLDFPWSVGLFAAPIAATVVQLLWSRGDQGRRMRTAALACSLPPTVAGVVQVVEPRWAVLLPAVTLAILILYLGLEAENLGLDFLTKLKNRRAFEHELQRRLRTSRGMLVLLIDLDEFKQINDQWGHAEGDRALVATAEILQAALHHNDCIGRLGGDEFAVVLDSGKASPEAIVARLLRRFDAWNQASSTPWQLLPSVGMAVVPPDQPTSARDLLARADQSMYQDKAARRAHRATAWTPS